MLAFDIAAKPWYRWYTWRAERSFKRYTKFNAKALIRKGIRIEFEKYVLPEWCYLILYFEANKKKYTLMIEGEFQKYYKAQIIEEDEKYQIPDDEIKRIIQANKTKWVSLRGL